MGYYTKHTFRHSLLDGTIKDDLPEEVIGFLDRNEGEQASEIKYAFDGSECKWYNHKEDMIWLSEQFPSILMILDGAGEEAGDLWRELFCKGKLILRQTIGEFPPIPEKLLYK